MPRLVVSAILATMLLACSDLSSDSCSSHEDCRTGESCQQGRCARDPGPSTRDAGAVAAPDAGSSCGAAPVAGGCDGLACSRHGGCELVGGSPVCRCDPGYSPTGFRCVAASGCVQPPAPDAGYPIAVLQAAPRSGLPGTTVQFDATGSSAVGGISGYGWSFGDGVFASDPAVSHTYTAAGLYCAELTVSDTAAQSSAARSQITIDREPLTYTVLPPSGTVRVDGDLGEFACVPGLWLRTPGGALAYVRLLWDSAGLHAGYDVTDPTPFALVTPGGAGEVYLDDAVELFVDVPPLGGDAMAAEDRQLVANVNGALYLDGLVAPKVAVRRLAAGYQVEVSIAWAEIGVSPYNGMVLGADFALDDRRSAEPGGAWDASDWSGLDSFTVPRGWQRLFLGP